VVGGEVYVFNIIFCTQKYRLQNKYSPFHPPRHQGHLFELFESGEEQEDGQTLSEGFEWLQAAPKSWFHARVENGLQRGKP
jgi:hypothetical protein